MDFIEVNGQFKTDMMYAKDLYADGINSEIVDVSKNIYCNDILIFSMDPFKKEDEGILTIKDGYIAGIIPNEENSAVSKKYVDDKIRKIRKIFTIETESDHTYSTEEFLGTYIIRKCNEPFMDKTPDAKDVTCTYSETTIYSETPFSLIPGINVKIIGDTLQKGIKNLVSIKKNGVLYTYVVSTSSANYFKYFSGSNGIFMNPEVSEIQSVYSYQYSEKEYKNVLIKRNSGGTVVKDTLKNEGRYLFYIKNVGLAKLIIDIGTKDIHVPKNCTGMFCIQKDILFIKLLVN